ncbi:MAG: TIGR03915 family putative DNA repair protein [Oscillospiraceae bacterium]|nr:TIGR03915 family putative DNA repair protein [Oscillospiraceae bacterium]
MSYRSDVAYVYDGSLEGLLCCVYESYYKKELPSLIFSHSEVQGTLFEVKEIETNVEYSLKVERSIINSISREAWRLVRLCYFSKLENREIHILNFLRMGYKIGYRVTNMLADDTVRTIVKTAKYVGGESHFYKEFLRFSEYNGTLVAIIEPKSFVLPMIVHHYCDRFPSEQFLIYDETHKYALTYQNGESAIVKLEHFEPPEACEKEEMYRELWIRFYDTIAIEGRISEKRRMNNMPKRYWKHLTELNESGEAIRAKRLQPLCHPELDSGFPESKHFGGDCGSSRGR